MDATRANRADVTIFGLIEAAGSGRLLGGRAGQRNIGSPMKSSGAKIIGFLSVIAAFGLTAGAMAENGENAEAGREPVVVELFSSQSCSSCVTASAFFQELANRSDVVALGWHVDYWNHLNTKHGRWEDPYSSEAHTKRQKKYNINIRNRSSVYTPQIVVGGASEAVGSSREKVGALLRDAQSEARKPLIDARLENEKVVFTVSESSSGGNAYLVTFQRSIKTQIRGGENAGVNFVDANVVTNVKRLGVVRRRGASFEAQQPEAGEGCALLVQEPGQGRIVAARYCAVQ